jgi:hypothetical protein
MSDDRYRYYGEHERISDPGNIHRAVVLDEPMALGAPKGIYVGGSGDIHMEDAEGHAEVWRNCQEGVIYPFRPTRVLSDDTTATDLIAVY